MENNKSFKARRMLHQLEGLQLCRKRAVIGKGHVLFVVHIYSDKGKDVEDVEVLKRYMILH